MHEGFSYLFNDLRFGKGAAWGIIVFAICYLISKVWGDDSDAEDNNVEAYISFLRKKLSFLGSRVQISTIRKVGYRLESGNG